MLPAKNLFSIVGPTANGKTGFAFNLAEAFDFSWNVISADSRQVYKGMEIGTGVDLPANFSKTGPDELDPFPYFQDGKLTLHGVSLCNPNEAWSLTHFRKLCQPILQKSWSDQSSVPVIVGGTGLYHRQLFNQDVQLELAPNFELRANAEALPVIELQEWLAKLDAAKLAALNNSDKQNPRRLIRAIEVAEHSKVGLQPEPPSKSLIDDSEIRHLQIGLVDELENIAVKIQQRVEERLRLGMIAEVEKLLSEYSPTDWELPAFSATGYKEVRAYLADQLDLSQMKELWCRRELQYAKRQLTWWKKESGITWFHVSLPNWQENANQVVKNWLKGSHLQ